MEAQNPKKDSGYIQELRSEKVRNIVGPMPPALIRYGITAICMALAMVILVCAFLPFRKTANGTVYIVNYYSDNNNYHITAKLKFDKSNSAVNIQGCKIICYNTIYQARGIIVTYNPVRTDMAEYIAELEFNNTTESQLFKDRETEFKIILSETTVLNKLLSTIKTKVD